MTTVERPRALGALLGTAIGDALGMPVDGLSHQNVRTYYRGIKHFRDDEQRRDLRAGQWTFRTQLALGFAAPRVGAPAGRSEPLRRLAADAPPPAGAAPATVAAIAVHAAAAGWTADERLAIVDDRLGAYWRQPAARAAAFGQLHALVLLLGASRETFDGRAFVEDVAGATAWAEARLGADDACSRRLARLAHHLADLPLDLQDRCDGTGFQPDQAWPFAVAMFARNPDLVEGTILSAINVGGDAATIGACTGALIGALHGREAFPTAWRAQVEGRARLEAVAVGADRVRPPEAQP